MTRLSGTLIKQTRFTNPLALRCIDIPLLSSLMPRYCLVAKNFWLYCQSWPLHTNSAAKKRRFSSSLSLLSSYDLEKDPDRFLAVLNFKEFKCGEDPRC